MKHKEIKGLKTKDKIKSNVFPPIAGALNSVGVSWGKLGRSKLASATLIAQGRKIAKTIRPENIEKPLNIYFLTMLGGHTHNVSVDIVLAWGLQQKGHTVHFIIDDQSMPITEEKKAGFENRWQELSARSFNFGYKYITACGFKVSGISEIVDINHDRNISDFTSVIEAGLLKHFKVGVINDKLKGVNEKKKMLEESAKISALIGDYLVKQSDADRVIMSHGIYPTWGPAFQILIENKIPVVTYGKTKRKRAEKFNWNATGDWWDVSEEWEKVKNIPLNEKQQTKIDHYLKTRITHSEDVLIYNFGELEEKELTIKRFQLDPKKLTYTLFTNVLWDAASAQREIAFKNPVEWVIETIEWFKNHPEKQLIVKIHPAEKVIGTNQPFAQLILELMELPGNVRLIKPEEKVNSWSIYKVTDLGLVHTSTAGMELPLVNVPCVVVSKTHFRDKGFSVDIKSKEEYFAYLENFDPSTINIEKGKSLAERYAYLLFERYQMPFEVFDEISFTNVRSFTFNTIDELFEKPYFNHIIESIIHKGQFLTEA